MANKTYTTMSLDALKFLCSVINKTVDLPTSVISDTSVATNTTHSSYKIGLDMDNMENDIKSYVDTAIAGLNKLTKEIINDKALVVKDNVLYLYKADDDVSNDYMQMMLINGIAVELGSTQVDMSDYYNKADSDNRFVAKLDLETLTTSFNDLVDKVSAIEDEIGTETLNTTSTTIKGAINEVADKSAIITLTKDEYEALAPKDTETYYITTDDMTMYKGESQVLGGKSIVGKETVLYEGKISAKGTYTLTDDVNNYDFIIINYRPTNGIYVQSMALNKNEISNCIDNKHNFICVYGYRDDNNYIAGYFNSNTIIISEYINDDITSITGYKFGEVTVQNTITNPSPAASYSTDEQLTGGTWIDGKPIYRKVINFGALPNTNEKAVPHGISNVENVIRQYGYVKYHDGVMQTLPHSNTLIEGNIMLYADATNVCIKTGRDRSNGNGVVVLEYTKTTD